ncbi:hypothetical protein ES703_78172 [subsurface metagenome]
MLIPTIVMACLAVILLVIGYSRGESQHITGEKKEEDFEHAHTNNSDGVSCCDSSSYWLSMFFHC